MSEGPFGRPDLEPDPEAPEERPAGPRPGPPRPPAGLASNATWIAGIAIVLVLVYVTLNTIKTDSNGSKGVGIGEQVPPFAAPLALANAKCGGKECDASVFRKAGGDHPLACDVRGPKVLNSCELAEKGPSVIAFLVAPSQKCIAQIDTLERLKPRFPDVQFAAVAIKGNHAKLNAIIKRHKWTLPVGYDHDGAVANAFAVAICPTITFVRQGGVVGATTLGLAGEREVIAKIRKVRSHVPRSTAP